MRHTRTILAALAATGLLLLAAPFAANALVSYPAGSLLQPNDVATSTIRNYAVSPSKIASGLDFTMHGLTTTNSTSTNATTTTLYVSSTSFGVGGVNYKWPASDGSAAQVLQTDGAHSLSWTSPGTSKLTSNFTAGEAIVKGAPVSFGDGTTVGTTTTVYDGIATTYNIAGAGSPWRVQDFYTPGFTTNAVLVSYVCSGTNTSAPFYLYAVDANGKPSGSLLTSATQPGCAGSTATTTAVFSTPYSLAANTEYAIGMITCTGCNYNVYGGNNTSTSTWQSTDSGTTWTNTNGRLAIQVAGINNVGGYIYESSAANTDFRFSNYFGIAETTASNGASIAIDMAGISTASTTLATSTTYYLGNANGTLSTSAGTNSKKIGRAITNGTLLLVPPAL